MKAPILRLTSLAHGGGYGCKLAPSVLRELLADQPVAVRFANLLVGTETDVRRMGQIDPDETSACGRDRFVWSPGIVRPESDSL
jgi:selenide,water dikinase